MIKYHVTYLVIIIMLATLGGILFSVAATAYAKYMKIQAFSTAREIKVISRPAIIRSVDPIKNILVADVMEVIGDTPQKVQILVRYETVITLMEPIFEDSAIVGFTKGEDISLSDIPPDAPAFVFIAIQEDGRIIAEEISVGSPFPRL